MRTENVDGIAIIGMSGRFPGAASTREFWENLERGIESISRFEGAQLEIRSTARSANESDYVKARGIIANPDHFDAAFFGIHPKEAELMDPQQRLFLECCWEAFEDAGYDPLSYKGRAGVFGGASFNTYFVRQQCARPGFTDDYVEGYQVDNYPVLLGANSDFLATRVSYKLNLRGPSFTMASGCSTSLLTVWQACQNLLSFQCDLALAGGVSVTFPQHRGYRFQAGAMVSPDGHCRPFDDQAQGTVFGDGVAVVTLKRVAEAIADGDHIYAVIKGSGINNDGAQKVGFTAPAVEGQAQAISLALADAGVDARSISYVEAHGTGTPLGDPIEFAALSKAFRAETQDRGFCAIGTAKANVGHLDVAAGVTGVIKTALSLRNGKLPKLLHFAHSNPSIDLSQSPFYVNTELTEWTRNGTPRRAGVSAFGVGGTNVHLILEEAPLPGARKPEQERYSVLPVSAKSEAAAERACRALADHLEQHPSLNLSDVAFTMQAGRHEFPFRRAVIFQNAAEAVQGLRGEGRQSAVKGHFDKSAIPGVAFLFPGQGSQYPRMGAGYYANEPVFRKQMDECAEILKPHLGLDLRSVLYPDAEGAAEDFDRTLLDQTQITQPALFAIEYAMARLWMHWGFQPQAMAGHSVGEFTAACLAGVFALDDVLGLIAQRGRLMQEQPAGAMLAVQLNAAEAERYLREGLSLAAVNSPSLSVLSGGKSQISEVEQELRKARVAARRLNTSCAAHSVLMDAALAPLAELIGKVTLVPPKIPFVSSVTGEWITPQEATSPEYWTRHLRACVRFQPALGTLLEKGPLALIEMGPGESLATFARQHPSGVTDRITVSPLPVPSSRSGETATGELRTTQRALAQLWAGGAEVNWSRTLPAKGRRRVSLPTYPFERKKFWFEPDNRDSALAAHGLEENKKQSGKGTLTTNMVVTRPRERRSEIEKSLANVIEELSGTPAAELDVAQSFLELGFDSLFLTQVSQAVQEKFREKISFRQLLEDESSIANLAEYLDARLPAEAMPEQAELPVAAVPEKEASLAQADANGISFSVETSSVGNLVKYQLDTMASLMAKQLEFLQGSAPAKQAVPQTSLKPPVTTSRTPEIVVEAAQPVQPKAEFKAFGPYKPIQQGPTGGLLPQQEKHLESLISRYEQKSAESKRLTIQYRRKLADPRVVSGFRSQWKQIVYPIVSVRSKGSRIWDVDGNEYIDILNGFGPTMFGHAPDFVVEAVHKQLDHGFEIGPQSCMAGKVAEMICDMVGMERATFCNTGSEAVMAAVRLARTVTARNKIALFAGAYHGAFDEVLVKQIRRGSEWHSGPIAPGIPKQKTENVTVLDYGTAESLEWIRTHAKELAAVLVEPVQSRHPALQPIEFLKEIRQITKESGTALIFDEVVTGFRSHPGGVQALFNIRADLATYGKVLAGGLPIGVIAGSSQFMDALDGGMWSYDDASYPEVGVTFFAGTFVRHPLALAAAHSVLKHLQESGPRLQENLAQKTAAMVGEINAFFELHKAPIKIETFSSIFYFSVPSDQPFGSLFYYHLRLKGIHVLEGFPCFLTTCHSEEDVKRIIAAFKESLLEMQRDGMLSGMADLENANGHGEIRELEEEKPLPAVPATRLEAPLTEAQREILLADQMGNEASCSFNESFTVTLRGRLSADALLESLQEVLDRHQAFRTTFDLAGNRQIIESGATVQLPVIDLSALSGAEQTRTLKDLIAADAGKPFDVTRGPLIRTSLVRLSGEENLLRVTAHHAVCDGWSTNVFLSELGKLYSAKVAGSRVQLAPAATFSAYAEDEIRFAETKAHAEVEAYWLGQFRDAPPVLDLPLDRPRPEIKTYEGGTVRLLVDEQTYFAFKSAAARNKCTLFAGLLGTFQGLLSRLSGQQDIVVGIPAAGQSLAGGESLIGHCVNFLPVRMLVDDQKSAAALQLETRKKLLDAYDNQRYTFGTLVRKLGLQHDPSRLPLIEVQFNLDKLGEEAGFKNLAIEVDPAPKAFVNFDLFLNAVEHKRGLILDCDFNSNLFDATTIERWLSYYVKLLKGIAADNQRSLSSVEISSEEEKVLLQQGNDTEADFPRDQTVYDLVDAQAARTPDRIAVAFGDRTLTYQDLARDSDRVAAALISERLEAETAIAVYLERRLEMPTVLLGILKSGAAYVPVDPTNPKERRQAILEDLQPSVVLTQRSLLRDLEGVQARALCIEDLLQRGSSSTPVAPARRVEARDLAYVLYTSGSTGKPKGVEVEHGALVNLLWSMKQKPGFRETDVLLAITTLSFDIAGLEIFLPLISGGRLVLASATEASDGARLLSKMRENQVSVMQATPATWRLLLDAGLADYSGVKILCGGEALPRELADRLLETGAELWNMYGPTETTIWSSTARVKPGGGPVPIGHPIANTRFYVLDRAQRLTPIGVSGELYIAGEGVARGYRGRPELTQSSFFSDPFYSSLASRMYKTGDAVRLRVDGELEFLGRLDHQVKLRGFRIELGEIESALAQHPEVNRCVVLLREDQPGEQRLVAYYVPNGSAAPDAGLLREFVSKKVPHYMVPSVFVVIDKVPLQSSGKVDRRSLPVPSAVFEERVAFAAPQSDMEKLLCQIWGDVLGLERVSIEDNLFRLGADSLQIFRISARANKAGLNVTPAMLLRNRTVATLAEALAEQTNAQLPGKISIQAIPRSQYRARKILV